MGLNRDPLLPAYFVGDGVKAGGGVGCGPALDDFDRCSSTGRSLARCARVVKWSRTRV